MARKVSHFKVGLFILICIGLGAGALIWIGAARFFEPTKTYVTFFDESIGGLTRGAGVEYLGLEVGHVSAIGLAPDGKLIRVVFQVNSQFKVTDSMAIELKPKGITGGSFLAIVQAPPNIKEVTPKVTFPVKYPLIPARRGEVAQIEQALEGVYKKLSSIDLEGLVAAWKKTGQSADAILSNADLHETIHNLREVSADLKAVVGGMGKPWTPAEWKKGFKDLTESAAAARKATEALESQLAILPPNALANLLARAERTVQEGEVALGSWDKQVDQSLTLFQQSLVEVKQVLAELRGLVQTLREQPGRILTRPGETEPFGR